MHIPPGFQQQTIPKSESSKNDFHLQQDHDIVKSLLKRNHQFIEKEFKPNKMHYFKNNQLAKSDVFVITCCDSKIAFDTAIKGTRDLFIHKNIGNQVNNNDLSIMASLQYAIEVLSVKDIIVLGHTGCDGIKAALSHDSHGLIDQQLQNIKQLWYSHRDEIDRMIEVEGKLNRLIELNVIEQVKNLYKTSFIQKAKASGKTVRLHGWILDVNTWVVKDLKIDEKKFTDIEPFLFYFKFGFGQSKLQQPTSQRLLKQIKK